METTKVAVPGTGVEFGLMLVKVPTIEDMVALNRADMEEFCHIGEGALLGPHRFKLLKTGAWSRNLEDVRSRLGTAMCPSGEYQKAFLERFPESDGLGPIGFPDPSWVDKDGKFWFPTLMGEVGRPWQPGFGMAISPRGAGWRWLIRSWC